MNAKAWWAMVLVCLRTGEPVAAAQDLAALLEQAEDAGPVAVQQPADTLGSPRLAQADRRHPPPSEADAATATSRVKAVFREEYSGPLRPADKAALAGEILELLQTTTNIGDRWALQSEALRLASESGQVELAISTAKGLSGEFQINAANVMLDVVKQLSSTAPAASAARLASECCAVARGAVDRGTFDTATKATVLAKALARKGKDADLVSQVNRLSIVVKDREKIAKQLASVLVDLKAAPANPELNAEAGLLLCLLQGRWAEGLPLLMKSGNPALARVAQLELNGGKSVREQIGLGDAWWALAESQKSAVQEAAQQRAIKYYNEAVNGAEGLERAMLEKRIASISTSGAGSGETIPLADLPELESAELYSGVTKNGTFNGVTYTCGGTTHPKGVYTPPKPQGTAMIAFRPPSGARRVRGTAGVFSLPGRDTEQPGSAVTMEVAVDGEVVWRSPPFTRREQVAKFDVPLNGGTRVELRTRAAGANNSCWAAWLDPVFVK